MSQALELWHNKKLSWLTKTELLMTEEDDIVVESCYSLVSLGTERLVTSENLTEEMGKNMSVPHMKGDLNTEFTYGYSLVGHVIQGSNDIKNKLVHLMHPHQNLVTIKSGSVFVVPDDMDPKLATLASNMETAVNALWDAKVEIGDSIMVIGYGTIGALISLLARSIAGVEVSVLDNNQNRNNAAISHGFQTYNENSGYAFDVVFNTSANEEMLQKALELTRTEGKIIELSWYGVKSVNIELGSDFHYGRKQIISSQVSQIPHRKQPVWNYKKRKELVFKLLKDLNPIYLIESEVPFLETPVFFEKLRHGEVENLGVVIKY